jgi:hypothetical protein
MFSEPSTKCESEEIIQFMRYTELAMFFRRSEISNRIKTYPCNGSPITGTLPSHTICYPHCMFICPFPFRLIFHPYSHPFLLRNSIIVNGTLELPDTHILCDTLIYSFITLIMLKWAQRS